MDDFKKQCWIKDFMERSGMSWEDAEKLYDEYVLKNEKKVGSND